MNHTTDPIARAFELAKSGTCHNIEEIHRVLNNEGFINSVAHLSGPSLKRQLYNLMKAAASNRANSAV